MVRSAVESLSKKGGLESKFLVPPLASGTPGLSDKSVSLLHPEFFEHATAFHWHM